PKRTPNLRRMAYARQLGLVVAVIAICDALALGVAAILAMEFRANLDGALEASQREVLEFSLGHGMSPYLFLMWAGCLVVGGAYQRRNIGGGAEEFRVVATSSLMAVGVFGAIAWLSRSMISRGYVLLCFVIGTFLLLVVRYAIRKALHALRTRGRLRSRVVAVCSLDALREVNDTLERLNWTGYSLVGACVPSQHGSPEDSESTPVPVLGGTGDIVAAVEASDADTVLVAGGGPVSSRALRRIGWELEGHDVNIVVVPGLIDVAGPRIHMRQVGGMPLVHLEKPQVSRAAGLVKGVFDLTVATVMLLVLAPVMAAVALAIKLQDGGPVFYRQKRSGKDGSDFMMLKFRSMVVDADSRLADLATRNECDGVLFKVKQDPRITRLGGWLRKHSVDELPQLFNVIKGEMSVVGPRPPLQHEVDAYPDDMHRRMLVRPGLTGLWQVSGRSDLPFEEAVRMDLYYVDNWSLMGDIIIMAKTVRAVLFTKGAY
ncbi:MAG: sugar transferase, partial [Nocardioides sp.]|nr:sugar transferase [Nocardioides sp.]